MALEAVDLVEKLLQLNPLKRLGAGSEDSDINFQALKDHQFFKDISFEKIKSGTTAPPIPAMLFENALNHEEQKNSGKPMEDDEDDLIGKNIYGQVQGQSSNKNIKDEKGE